MSPVVTDLQLDGLTWQRNGQVVLSGALLALADRLDRAFLGLAARWGATEYRFPTFVSARELHKLDYFRSFPHLATFPVCLDDDDPNLAAFADGPVLDEHDHLHLTRTRPIDDVLTPAACYPLYIHLQGSESATTRYATTRNTCFRREEYYAPLQRQWSFSMREVVAIGTTAEVRSFLDHTQAMVSDFLAALDLPVAWEVATDPFFRPAASAQHLSQRLDPTKQESVFDGHLAIGSVNLHHDHFGATYDIRAGDREATSGCVAFGLDRWLFALTRTHGADPARWPDVEAAATAAFAR